MSESILTFRFTGRMASEGQLNFYEAGRFYYAAARSVYLIEEYRLSRRVLGRLTKKINADIRIGSPEKGSFLVNVIVNAAPVLQDPLVQLSLETLYTHIVGRYFPAVSATSDAVKLAQEQTKQTEALVRLSEQETKRLEMYKELSMTSINAVSEMAKRTSSLYEELVRLPSETDTTDLKLKSVVDELKAALNREETVSSSVNELVSIEDQRKLESHLVNAIKDLALPLRTSANSLQVFTNNNDNALVHIDEFGIDRIQDDFPDDRHTMLRGRVKSLDRETGYGKIRVFDKNIQGALNFRIPGGIENKYWGEIVNSLNKGEISASFQIYRDRNGVPSRLIFDKIITN